MSLRVSNMTSLRKFMDFYLSHAMKFAVFGQNL